MSTLSVLSDTSSNKKAIADHADEERRAAKGRIGTLEDYRPAIRKGRQNSIRARQEPPHDDECKNPITIRAALTSNPSGTDGKNLWGYTDSNREPSSYEPPALTVELYPHFKLIETES